MRKWHKLVAAIVAIAGLGLLAPIASAQVPPTPGLPPLPSQVQDAINTVVGSVPAIPAIPGVKEASVTPGHSEASVVEIPGVVTFGKSEASTTGTSPGSKVTVLNVGGQDILVKNGDANGGTWGGQAAAAGAGIDALNDQLCPGGPPAANTPKQCVLLLYSPATTKSTSSETAFTKTTSDTNSAQFRALSIYSPQGPESLTLGYTTATSNHINVVRKPSGPVLFSKCTDIATSFLVVGGGQLAAVILANPDPAGGIKFSVLQTC